MSKKIKKFTEAQACKALDIDIMQLKSLLRAADQVMQEIAPDVASCYKGGCIPHYAMIEMVCDCDRVTEMMTRTRKYLPSDEAKQQLDEAVAKFKAASIEVKYGVLGIELSSRVFVV